MLAFCPDTGHSVLRFFCEIIHSTYDSSRQALDNSYKVQGTSPERKRGSYVGHIYLTHLFEFERLVDVFIDVHRNCNWDFQ